MQDRREDAGTCVVQKRQERKTIASGLQGDVTIKGRKFWVSAWIKTCEKSGQQYMSLACRHADEEAKPKPKPAPAIVDEEIPF